MICSSCGTANTEGQRFCGACGHELGAELCARCSTVNPPGFRFCGTCGAPLRSGASSRDPAEAPAEERRWATVVFADLSGFTGLSERMDPEDVRTLVDRCSTKLGEIVERYGGVVDNVIGDAVLAVFGAPVAHEDDPERAVRCALEMIRCAEDNHEEFAGLPLRIGVNTGEMMFAPVGPEGARAHTIMGDAVNVGARLQAAAPRAGVLVGEETYRATRGGITYEDAGLIEAKGKQGGVRAWRAVEAVSEPVPRQLSTAPMVGRDGELELLRSVWERVVAERRPHLATVLGPPGIGKSRLSREIASSVEKAGGSVLRGRSLPYAEKTGYGAFAQQVMALAGILETDPVSEVQRKLAALVDDLGSEVADGVSAIVGVGRALVGDRQVLFFAARKLIEHTARTRPLLLIFEDIHWSDASLLDLIESLASRVRESPVMLLTLARPELLDERPSWGAGPAASVALPLSALSEQDSLTLARRLVPHLAATTQVAQRLAEAAAGNPLFIEELAASVVERATDSVGELPTNVRAIIAARIDALPPAERRVLLDAAAVGRTFWRGALERFGGSERLADVLESLEGRDLIRREQPSGIAGDAEFTFKHILIREVAYATVPKATRRARHAIVAGFLEDATGDRRAEWASLLAHHWREAGDHERAIEHLLVASEHAERAWAKAAAIASLSEAIELVPRSDEGRRRALMLRRALTTVDAGDIESASEQLDALLPMLEGFDLCEAHIARCRCAVWSTDAATALLHAEEAVGLAETLGDQGLRSAANAMMAETIVLDGRITEALALSERALGSWPPGERGADFASFQSQNGLYEYWSGDYERSLAVNRRSYELALETHSVEAMMVGGAQVAMSLVGLGQHEEALPLFRELVERGRDLETAPRLTARTLNAWGGALREIFDLTEARQLNEEAIELGKRIPFTNAEAQGMVDMMLIDIEVGEYGAAEEKMRRVRELTETLRGWHEWLVGGRLATATAQLAIGMGRLDEAADVAADASARAQRHGRLKYVIGSEGLLGAALVGLGRTEDGVARFRSSLEGARTLRHPPAIWRAAAGLGSALKILRDDAGAAEAFGEAARTIEDFASTLAVERREIFLSAREITEIARVARGS